MCMKPEMGSSTLHAPAPEFGIDELSGFFPAEVGVVHVVVNVEHEEELGEIFGGFEVVDMNVRLRWCYCLVIAWMRSHHDGHDVIPKNNNKTRLNLI